MPSFSSSGDLIRLGVGGTEVCSLTAFSLSVLGGAAGRLGSATGAWSSVEEGIVFGTGSGSGDGEGEGEGRPLSDDFALLAAGRGGIAGVDRERGCGDFDLAGRGGTDGGAWEAIVEVRGIARFQKYGKTFSRDDRRV
jgi:hypothetical protein